MFDFSPVQILIVLAIALLVFGPKRLPELARSVGRGVREFRSGITMDDAPASPPQSSRAVIARPDVDDRPAAAPAPADRHDLAEDDEEPGDLMVSGDDQPPGSRA